MSARIPELLNEGCLLEKEGGLTKHERSTDEVLITEWQCRCNTPFKVDPFEQCRPVGGTVGLGQLNRGLDLLGIQAYS